VGNGGERYPELQSDKANCMATDPSGLSGGVGRVGLTCPQWPIDPITQTLLITGEASSHSMFDHCGETYHVQGLAVPLGTLTIWIEFRTKDGYAR
jgi:hypothetical protein